MAQSRIIKGLLNEIDLEKENNARKKYNLYLKRELMEKFADACDRLEVKQNRLLEGLIEQFLGDK